MLGAAKRAPIAAALIVAATTSAAQNFTPGSGRSDAFQRLDAPAPGDVRSPSLGVSGAAATTAAPQPAISLSLELRRVTLTPPESRLATLPEITAIAGERIGDNLSLPDLEALRRRMTEALVAAGYVSSGARIREINLESGEVAFEIVEGRLADLRVVGDLVPVEDRAPGDLTPDYIRARAAIPEAPFNIRETEEALRILLRDRAIERIDGAISPAGAPGETRLTLDVTPSRPYDAALTLDNSTPDAIGEETATLFLTARNVLTSGDQINFEFGGSEGRRSVAIGADAPIWPGGPSLFATLEGTSSRFIRDPVDALDIRSTFFSAAVGVRAPIVETSRRRLTSIVSFAWTRTRSELGGRGFSFAEGVENGVSKTAVLSAAQEFVDLGERRTIAARLSANLGLPALGATRNDAGAPDGEFASLVGQAQVAQIVGDDLTIIGRLQGQLASGALLPVEQIAIGGRETVRGFGEAALSGDDAAVASLEARAPIGTLAIPDLTPVDHAATISFAPFIDAGRVWRRGEGGQTLIGAGAGLLWSPAPNVDASLYYGASLKGAGGGGAQGEGVHFAISISLP